MVCAFVRRILFCTRKATKTYGPRRKRGNYLCQHKHRPWSTRRKIHKTKYTHRPLQPRGRHKEFQQLHHRRRKTKRQTRPQQRLPQQLRKTKRRRTRPKLHKLFQRTFTKHRNHQRRNRRQNKTILPILPLQSHNHSQLQ